MSLQLIIFCFLFSFFFRKNLQEKFSLVFFPQKVHTNLSGYFEKFMWLFFWTMFMCFLIRPLGSECVGLLDSKVFDGLKMPDFTSNMLSISSSSPKFTDSKWFWVVMGGFVPTLCISLGVFLGRKSKPATVVERVFEDSDIGFGGKFPLYQDHESVKLRHMVSDINADLKTRFFFLDDMVSKTERVATFADYFKKEHYEILTDVFSPAEIKLLFSPGVFTAYLKFSKRPDNSCIDFLCEKFPNVLRPNIIAVHHELALVRGAGLTDLVGISAAKSELASLNVTSTAYLGKIQALAESTKKLDLNHVLDQIVTNLT